MVVRSKGQLFATKWGKKWGFMRWIRSKTSSFFDSTPPKIESGYGPGIDVQKALKFKFESTSKQRTFSTFFIGGRESVEKSTSIRC